VKSHKTLKWNDSIDNNNKNSLLELSSYIYCKFKYLPSMHASIVFIIFKVESMFVFTFICIFIDLKLYIVGLSWTIFYALYAHIIIN
jgi:hypothetical protein